MIRWVGEKLRLLHPPDEVSAEVRKEAHKAVEEARGVVSDSKRRRQLQLEYELHRRQHR